jgi:SAM-dependent methyltransferase/uncharacterized protein YbaR (Trm112 family)
LRLRHFETLRPVCPVCRPSSAAGYPLTIAHVYEEAAGHVVEAILHCTNAECQREFPVLDGVPLLIGNLRHYISENPLRLLMRRDLGDQLESLIGDCMGPGSDFDTVRQQVSAYAWDHYGDLDPAEEGQEQPGSMLEVLSAARHLARPTRDGPILDVGCGCGRGSFALAGGTGEIVLGVDLHYPMLQVATHVLREGIVRYPRRRVGLVYDRREFAVSLDGKENVDFWACDAAALPFQPGTFALAVGLNVLDSVYAPRALLESLANVVGSGGKIVLSCPYDWSPAATPLETWLGGHSQRSPIGGSSEAVLRTMLSQDDSATRVPGLRLTGEIDDLPWRVRLHARGTMSYRLHMVAAERLPDP